jgi:hypothetical protein
VNGKMLLLACCVLLCGCGGSPTAPETNGTLPFRSGAYLLDVIGDGFACGDVKNPQAGTAVTVGLNMDVSANQYVARSAQGGLVLRFQRTPTANSISPFSLGLTGTATGSADDEGRTLGGISIPPKGTRLTLSSSVPLSGELPSPALSHFAFGTLNGTVTFSRDGVSSTCPAAAAGWTLNRLP